MEIIMTKTVKQFIFVFVSSLIFAFFAALLSPSASARDCLTECMDASGCWSSRSDENVSYCRGTEATCEAQCRNHKSYGAIAYSAKNGAYGFSDSWNDQKQAEKTALGYCSKRGPKCENMVWFYNSCGAVAADGKKTGWGQGSSEGAASNQALEKCKKSGGKNCEVKISHCSR